MGKVNKWVSFSNRRKSKSGKTFIWNVESNVKIGVIKWHGAWRAYALYPDSNTLFEKTCLRTIADFCESATKKHRQDQRNKKDANQ